MRENRPFTWICLERGRVMTSHGDRWAWRRMRFSAHTYCHSGTHKKHISTADRIINLISCLIFPIYCETILFNKSTISAGSLTMEQNFFGPTTQDWVLNLTQILTPLERKVIMASTVNAVAIILFFVWKIKRLAAIDECFLQDVFVFWTYTLCFVSKIESIHWVSLSPSNYHGTNPYLFSFIIPRCGHLLAPIETRAVVHSIWNRMASNSMCNKRNNPKYRFLPFSVGIDWIKSHTKIRWQQVPWEQRNCWEHSHPFGWNDSMHAAGERRWTHNEIQ